MMGRVGSVLVVLLAAGAGYLWGAGGAERRLMEADEAFNRALAARQPTAFASWIAEDAVFLGGGLLEGRNAILEAWSVFLDRESGRTLAWQPHTAVVSRCEDLGYTLGDYTAVSPDEVGAPQRSVGTYLTVWRKSPEGAWRVVADGGTPPMPER